MSRALAKASLKQLLPSRPTCQSGLTGGKESKLKGGQRQPSFPLGNKVVGGGWLESVTSLLPLFPSSLSLLFLVTVEAMKLERSVFSNSLLYRHSHQNSCGEALKF